MTAICDRAGTLTMGVEDFSASTVPTTLVERCGGTG
jgi:hypothetical protein